MSGPTVCGSFADGDENAHEVAGMESVKHQRARMAAWRRSLLRDQAGKEADRTYPLRPEIVHQLGRRRRARS